ncbi:DUF1592 domain-containing protein [Planctomicrobium piriforme]|uniref:Planctomycete cytochrome C n=1 Tax=Planctomicrobium piriforme TaxID=1576369 RepID=A0A1I3SGN6_9PLAN|nr:DUF1592 domain-containing protein [Planctomicrobium piriforme]SFJ57182.1 Planctomycete cytochrome C [Planctomicrobium piriforme]
MLQTQFRFPRCLHVTTALALVFAGVSVCFGQPAPVPGAAFLKSHCYDCHDTDTKEGGLDLTKLKFDLSNPVIFAEWVKVHDRVRDGEMPPAKPKPTPKAQGDFVQGLARPLAMADAEFGKREGRSTWRRMNRYEYENTLRDVLGVPWLQVRDMLPEDGEAFRFNKVGDALDVSHVQMARYLSAAEYALREVVVASTAPASKTQRYYARDQGSFLSPLRFGEFNGSPERATFPILGTAADTAVLEEKGPNTVGESNPEQRELEAMGVVASAYEPLEPQFNAFRAPASGRYRLKLNALTFWAGPLDNKRWWVPNRALISPGRTREPVTLYAQSPPRQLRKLGTVDVTPDPSVVEITVDLLKGETIRPDAVRLFRSRPPAFRNPLATKEGQPGVAFRWLEVEGPLPVPSVGEGMKLLFGDLPVKVGANGQIEVKVKDPKTESRQMMAKFMRRAYRRPMDPADPKRFVNIVNLALESGVPFADAMLAGYSAVLCSPSFVTLEEHPGRLDDHALASRLSYFLWNSEPDAELRALATSGDLKKAEVLRRQTDRLLNDPRSQRFVEAFLDYWLDLRKSENTSPDAALYPDYHLDDYLVDSAIDETRAFFNELLKQDLPVRNLIDCDFVMINERLATHYGIPGVEGSAIRKVTLPKDHVRGGLLTQASILKVTANGTTTSPVTRGVWINERILGIPVPPPPSAVAAVEPDTRGATTIRQQLEKHRNDASCNKCHVKIDPTGFALENFDILGGWRVNYRAHDDDKKKPPQPAGYGHDGQPFEFDAGPVVDAAGSLPDGRTFKDVRELKKLLVTNERLLAQNLASQMIVFATGSPVRFADRQELEFMTDGAQSSKFCVRTIIQEVVLSKMFQNK